MERDQGERGEKAEGRKETPQVQGVIRAIGQWEHIFSRSNLFRALERVQANGGAAGVDGMTVEELPEHLKAH